MKIAAIATIATLVAGTALAGWDDDCRYTSGRRAVTPAAGVTKVIIRADAGSLTVNGQAGAAQITSQGTACTSDEDFLSSINLTLRRAGSVLHVEADIPEKTVVFGFFSARLDFEVTLPAGLPVEIEDGSGWIRASNTGAMTIDDDSGAIDVRNVRGPLVIRDDSGAVDVETVAGNVTIEDDSGEISVRDVTGDVDIEDDSGAITVTRVEGSLHIRDDDSGSITAREIRRDVVIDSDGSGAVEVADVGGRFVVGRKTSGAIDHVRVAGRISLPHRD